MKGKGVLLQGDSRLVAEIKVWPQNNVVRNFIEMTSRK